MNDDIDPKWLSQLRKGYLELCVLLALRQQQSSYGFALLQHFHAAGLEINEGTLYPLLNRMHKNGWLDSQWQTPADSGHPRRFYSLSRIGAAQLPAMLEVQRQQQSTLAKLQELE